MLSATAHACRMAFRPQWLITVLLQLTQRLPVPAPAAAIDIAWLLRGITNRSLLLTVMLHSMQVQEHYGVAQRKAALVLRRRSHDMLTKGFEWTLEHGSPQNAPKYK